MSRQISFSHNLFPTRFEYFHSEQEYALLYAKFHSGLTNNIGVSQDRGFMCLRSSDAYMR